MNPIAGKILVEPVSEVPSHSAPKLKQKEEVNMGPFPLFLTFLEIFDIFCFGMIFEVLKIC